MSAPVTTRYKLYRNYCMELNKYDPEPASPLAIHLRASNVADTYLSDPDFFCWKDIVYRDKIVGFLIVGYNLYLHGPGLYICEAYTAPEYRKKNLMTSAVDEVMAAYDGGPVFMEIFDANNTAKTFWKNIMAKLSVSLVNTAPSHHVSEGLTEYFYYKNKNQLKDVNSVVME